jgi:serine/threonine protein kinase/tetratricopeptide (TPR) repeat protein
MTPERWQRIQDLFHAALQHEPSQRPAFLADACAGDVSLQREVESLLAAHEEAASFLEAPAFAGPATWLADGQAEAAVGRQLGPYRLGRAIGRGGMGAVYLGERADGQYQKQVAIKLVRDGFGGEALRRRFHLERQILAALDHPNIAKLLDGGTTADGLPYLVMDYVEGLPIDAYCDAHRLSIAERLTLFRAVCAAVQYAHRNLVVHRDLKPSNILVTAEGVPKLLDFGIAKLLQPELPSPSASLTLLGLQALTPEYASPEQVRGEPITTASDVYSLGVVLYELLTGHRPYRLKSRLPHEMARVICEEEPQRPSIAVGRVEEVAGADGTHRITPESVSQTREGSPERLRRRLAGDLDNIVLMALRKEPHQRYASVEQLAEDLRRHLEGLPVLARPQTLGYRGGKFMARHKTGVMAAALIGLTLVGGILATRQQARRAEAERARAERRFNDVRQLANAFMFEFHDAIEKLPGSTPARQLVVNRALEYLDSLAQEAGDSPALQRELAAAYTKVGNVQWQRYYANLGDTAGALASHRKALAIREAVAAKDPAHTATQRDLAYSHVLVGDALAATGDLAGAVASYRRSLAVRQALAAASPGDARLQHELAVSHQRLGDTLGNPRFPNLGDTAGAVEHYGAMLAIFQALADAEPTSAPLRHSVSIGHEKIGDVMTALAGPARALESYREALAIREALAAAEPTNAQLRRDLAVSHRKVGLALAATGDHTGALESLRQARAIREALAAADPTNAAARRDLARIHADIGQVLAAAGDVASALESYQQSLAVYEALAAADPTNNDLRLDLADTQRRLEDLTSRAAVSR